MEVDGCEFAGVMEEFLPLQGEGVDRRMGEYKIMYEKVWMGMCTAACMRRCALQQVWDGRCVCNRCVTPENTPLLSWFS